MLVHCLRSVKAISLMLCLWTVSIECNPENSVKSSISDNQVGRTKQPDTYSRFKNLDRILHRLDGSPAQVRNRKESSYPLTLNGPESKGEKWKQGFYPTSSKLSKSRKDLKEIASSKDEQDSYSYEDEDEEADEEDEMYDELQDAANRMSADRMSQWGRRYRTQYLQGTRRHLTTTPPPTQSPMTFSQYKWQQLGSRQGVDKYRRYSSGSYPYVNERYKSSSGGFSNNFYSNNNNDNFRRNGKPVTRSQSGSHHRHHNHNHHHSQSATLTHEAVTHTMKVAREGSCRIPKPRLVRVQDFYPHPGKTYLPHCTILHQCTDDTGCCRHDVLTCSPKTSEKVELPFFTYSVESMSLGNSGGSTVERLIFYNHTECECRDKMEEMMPRDMSAVNPQFKSMSELLPGAANQNIGYGYDGDSFGGRNISNVRTFQSLSSRGRFQRNFMCKCPTEFSERILSNGSCLCDCFDKQKECLRLKRGKRFFSMNDKWCIQSGRCEIPECSYGGYIHLAGRCPRKKESSWHRYLTRQ